MPDPATKRTRNGPSRKVVAEEARKAARAVLRSHRNDAEAALAEEIDAHHATRQRLKKARGLAPAEGDVLLKGDDVKRWEAVKSLNLAPDEITKLVTRAESAEKALAERADEDLLSEVSTVAKFPKDSLLDLKRARNLKIEVKQEKVKSKNDKGEEVISTQPVVYVTEAGEGKVPMEFTKYVEDKAPTYKGLFETEDKGKTEPVNGGTRRTIPVTQSPVKDGNTAVVGGDTAKAPASVDTYLEANRAAAAGHNPLKPKKTA